MYLTMLFIITLYRRSDGFILSIISVIHKTLELHYGKFQTLIVYTIVQWKYFIMTKPHN